MLPYLEPLVRSFEKHSNTANAGPMKKYMRDQFDFFGIKAPQRRELTAQFFRTHGYPQVALLPSVVRQLWQLPQREYHYFALDLLERTIKKLPAEFTDVLQELVVTKSWWDTVDWLATRLVGRHFLRYPALMPAYVARWRKSSDLWLRRTALLFQLNYKDKTDVQLLFDIIGENRESDEFFIQKAIGWTLRQYSKTAPDTVRQFVASTNLTAFSEKEALKWLNRGAQ
jgi:3-methyladenine DNA glycosylase AlkD